MTIEIIDNHLALALARVIEQYKESPRLLSVLSTFVAQVQELENALIDLVDDTWINTAVGAQLDELGLLLNVTRGGFSDTVYRTRLNAAIVRHTSSGRAEQVISAFKLLAQADQVIVEEVFPGTVRLTAIGAVSPAGTTAELRAGIDGALAAGIGFEVLIISSTTPFVFDGDTYPGGQGFGDSFDSTVGGNFAEII
jgi:hypothetical protein